VNRTSRYYAGGGSDEEKPEFPDDLDDIDQQYGDAEYDDADEHWPEADDGAFPDADDGAFPDADAEEYGGGAAAEPGANLKKTKISKAQLKKIEVG
jgi:hypothetical protein